MNVGYHRIACWISLHSMLWPYHPESIQSQVLCMPWKESQPAKKGRVALQDVFTHVPHQDTSVCQCIYLVQQSLLLISTISSELTQADSNC